MLTDNICLLIFLQNYLIKLFELHFFVFEPGLNILRITLAWLRRVRVHLFSISSPHEFN